MPPMIETLGYQSRTAAAQALRAKGLSHRQIAERIGIEPQKVSALLASAKRQKSLSTLGKTVVVPVDTLTAMTHDAKRRGLSVHELARRILETVADDCMVGAVLDDDVDATASTP